MNIVIEIKKPLFRNAGARIIYFQIFLGDFLEFNINCN